MRSSEDLLKAIVQIHLDGYKLCKISFDRYFPNSGNMSVFCHSDEEYKILIKVREKITLPSDNPNQKQFTLKEPFVISARGDVPETIYPRIYIRKPDSSPYGKHSGDVDFYAEDYKELVAGVKSGGIPGAKLYDQKGVGTFVQLSDIGVWGLAYIGTKKMTEEVRIKH